MARASLRDIRKQEIIDAAIDVIGEVGLSDATLNMIGKRAGLSAPLMVHYFEDKSLIIEASMRQISAVLSREFLSRIGPETDPAQRLDALIDACFSMVNFAQGASAAWLEFWLQIPRKPSLKRLHKAIAARFWSNIRFAFSGLVPKEAVNDGVHGLAALIDGFWWRFAIDPELTDLEQAKRICRAFVQRYVASCAPAARRRS
ncbi:MAG TPA: transcriptional regulator BetI [Dongiaceae bacterium]|jgi:TetR/AcrR family transcriptional repressor of bet genes|nr:transcriptional regulator BetI [Dongiaceae bacterium]